MLATPSSCLHCGSSNVIGRTELEPPPHPLQSIYDQIPKVNCTGACGRDRHDTCCGPIVCTSLEAKLLDEYNGVRSPWESTGGGDVMMVPEKVTDHICPHLSLSGRCDAYEVRPLICRLFGAVRKLQCPWGCKPERFLTEIEVTKLFKEAEMTARSFGGGSRGP